MKHPALAVALLALPCLAAPSRDRLTLDVPGAPVAFTPPMAAAVTPCEGNNIADNYVDGASMGGPMVGISWVPANTVLVTRVEVFTGELTGPSELAIWSDDGGAPSQPLAALGVTSSFLVSPPDTWYGADLDVPVPVVAGAKYWVAWDPTGGEQCACTDDPGDVQQAYWGSFDGGVSGGANWFGPFSFPDRRWKFRMLCGPPDGDGDGVPDDRDRCPDTQLPELAPALDLGTNRWADTDGDGTFDTTPPGGIGPKATFTLQDTNGCSCSQIVEALGIGEGHEKFGCSTGIVRRWVSMQAP